MGEKAGGKFGLVVSLRPKSYEMTPQQFKLKEVIKECGIKKGMTKAELQNAMVDCVGVKMRAWGVENRKKQGISEQTP